MKSLAYTAAVLLLFNAPHSAFSHGDDVPNELPQLNSKDTKKINLTSIEIDQFGEKVSRQFISGENAMLAWFTLEKGASVPWHSHVSEQITHILQGEMILTVGTDKKEHHLKKGDVLVIPSNVPHKGEALVNTIEIDVFSPIRQDWLDGTDQYLQNIEDKE